MSFCLCSPHQFLGTGPAKGLKNKGFLRGGQRSLPGDVTRTWTVDGGYGNEPQTEYAFGCR